jgi:hypothetical protein
VGSGTARANEELLSFASGERRRAAEWERLVIRQNVSGKKVHDARLVAITNFGTGVVRLVLLSAKFSVNR